MDTTNHHVRRLPKGERRVRFADTVGSELVSIFLIDLISNYYFAHTLINNHQNNSSNNNDNKNKITKIIKNNNATTTNNINIINTNSTNNTNGLNNEQISYLCEFTQPISLISFKERVKLNKVHLETCSVNSRAGNISISCTVRVLNLCYDKSVIVRYTTDEWHTSTDSLASYKPGTNDGWSDGFTSTFSVTNQVKHFAVGQRIQFAIRYAYGGDNVYWDNNGGLNYSIKKISKKEN